MNNLAGYVVKRVWSRKKLVEAYGTPTWEASWKYFVEADVQGELQYAYTEDLEKNTLILTRWWNREGLRRGLIVHGAQEWPFWSAVLNGKPAPDVICEGSHNKSVSRCTCNIIRLWNGAGHETKCSENRTN